MKRFLIVLTALILGYLAYDTARYYLGWYIDLQPDAPVSAFMSTDAQHLYMDRGAGPEEFTVKGVNLGVGIPGEWATDYAVSKETYLRWFAQMQEMGANTVRVYITLHDDFYNAFYEYNTAREEANEEPLWLIHGVWVNDYIQNSHRDAYDKDFWLCQDRHTVFSEFFQLPPKWGALIVLACRYKCKPARSTHIYLNLS